MITARTHQVAGVVCLLFIGLSIADGLWKPGLIGGPMIYFWAYDIVKWVVAPLAGMLTFHHLTGASSREYGLAAPLGWKDILYVTPLTICALFATNFFAYRIASVTVGGSPTEFSYLMVLQNMGPLWIVGTVYLAATAGLWESIFYIGLPWLWFARVAGTSPSARRVFVAATSLLFAIAHFENGLANMVGAFFFQLVAARWYFRLQTLWPIIAAHALVDVYYFWPWPWLRGPV